MTEHPPSSLLSSVLRGALVGGVLLFFVGAGIVVVRTESAVGAQRRGHARPPA